MIKRKLGNSGLEIAPLALGGNVFGWTVDEPTAFTLVDSFVAAGFNLIDTADTYSRWVPGNKGGESETIIGKWLKRSGNRSRVVIGTKVGSEMGTNKKGLSKAYILRAVEGSLKRLQSNTIDLYQSHRDDPGTPLEETLEAYAQLIKDGKVRAIGASNYTAARLSEALAVSKKHGLPRYEVLQPLYNLYDRADFENELAAVCTKNEIGVVPYYALASGFLSGKYRSDADVKKSPRGQMVVQKYLNDRGRKIRAALDGVAARLKATPAQVAIAWMIARPAITAPIASATSVAQLNDILAAARLKLDAEAMADLDAASAA